MTDTPIILVGAGGHALVLLDALMLSQAVVLGLVDSDPKRAGHQVLGVPVLGGDEVLARHAPQTVQLINAIGSAGRTERRRSVYERLRGSGYVFASVLHPSAVVSGHAVAAAGTQIMAGALVQACAVIGENTIVNTGATVEHECVIGAHCHVAPGAILCGNVRVGEQTHVGAGATVIQGVRIGARCTVAAGAVVLADVAEGETVAGVPARQARS